MAPVVTIIENEESIPLNKSKSTNLHILNFNKSSQENEAEDCVNACKFNPGIECNSINTDNPLDSIAVPTQDTQNSGPIIVFSKLNLSNINRLTEENDLSDCIIEQRSAVDNDTTGIVTIRNNDSYCEDDRIRAINNNCCNGCDSMTDCDENGEECGISRYDTGQIGDQEKSLEICLDPIYKALAFSEDPGKLVSLSLTGLELDSIHFDLTDLVNVTDIDLSNNNLETLPDSFVSLKKCIRLNISKNKFTEVPSCLFKDLYFIKDLDVSFNIIKYFNSSPLCLPYLVNLNASHNSLTYPPLWLLHDVPSSLLRLDLSYNPCLKDKLLSVFLETYEINRIASRIEELNITNTGFSPTNINFLKQFTCLKILNVATKGDQMVYNSLYNFMEDLPEDSLYKMPLEVLDVTGCNLSCLPHTVHRLTHLKEFRISLNNFSWFPDSFVQLECLKILDASKCHIICLPKDMGLLTSLAQLWLSFNDISSLPDLSPCKDLKILDLYSNSFFDMPDNIKSLSLEAFDICENYLNPSSYQQVFDKVPYQELKNNLRCVLSDCSRSDLIKIENQSRSGSSSSSSSSWCSLKSRGSRKRCNFSPCSRYSKGSSEVEDWDVDPDDAWDPNSYTNCRKWTSDDSLSRCRSLAAFNHKENYFCPYQERSNFYQNIYIEPTGEDEEGQFDDA